MWPGKPRVQHFSFATWVEVASHAVSPSRLRVFGDPNHRHHSSRGGGVPLPACSPGTREHRGLGTIVPLAPWSIPGQEILPWVLSPHGWDGYGKATAKWGMVAPTRHNPLRETIQLCLQSCPRSLVPGEQAGD